MGVPTRAPGLSGRIRSVDLKVAGNSKLLDRDDIVCVHAAHNDAPRGVDSNLVAIESQQPATVLDGEVVSLNVLDQRR
jgi:hypothetical protein